MRSNRRWSRDRSTQIRVGAVGVVAALMVGSTGTWLPGGNSAVDLKLAASGPDGPGVKGGVVKVDFIATDLDAVKNYTGFNTAEVGDQEAQVRALATWVNANGGLGGKKMEAIYRLYDAQNDSPSAEEQLCNKITQDDKAFAVVMTGQYQTNARPCYSARQTLVIDASLYAMSQDYFNEHSPYLWTASFPEYNSFVRSYVKVLVEQAFFEGEKEVGLIVGESPLNRKTVEKLAVPLLKEAGITPSVSLVDTTATGTLFEGLTQAAVTFRSKKIDRIMFLGGSRLASVFASIAATQDGFAPRYAVSSFDNPTFFVSNPDTIPDGTMDGMVGIGFHPPQDIPDKDMPFPAPGVETVCMDIYKAAGITFPTRESARVALPYCDAVRMLKLGADNLAPGGNFNAAGLALAIDANGASFQTASGFGNRLGNGARAASGGYRVLKYDEAKGHFVYVGPEVPFDEK